MKFELEGVSNWSGLKTHIIVFAATAAEAVARAQINHSTVTLLKSTT